MLICAKCFACTFEVVFELQLNKHGFYEVPHGYCPQCMSQLDQDVTHAIRSTGGMEVDNGQTKD